MTSISILSGAIARIQCLTREHKRPESLSGDAEKLVQGLKSIKSSLSTANQETKRSREFVQKEKQIVEHCYDIVDAIADILLGSPFNLTKILANKVGKKSRSTELEKQLGKLKNELEELLSNPVAERNVTDTEQSSDQANPASRGQDLRQTENQVRAALLKQPKESSVVCIWGKSGIGKSTLAKKAFYHDEVQQHFEAFARVSVNQNLQTKKVFQALLQQLDPCQTGDIRNMTEIKLIEQIFNVLKQKKCLILLDDIWTLEDWQSVRVALPTGTSSKIFITTPKEVAEKAGDAIFEVPPLSEDECSVILKDNASFDHDDQLQTALRKTIYNLSGGSRLIALILGKSLKEEDATAGNQVVFDYLSQKGEPQVLGVCYERLAHELKPCLLYLGQFPPGHNVEVEKLYLLLTAEDLISPADPGSTQSEGVINQSANEKLRKQSEGNIDQSADEKLSMQSEENIKQSTDEKLIMLGVGNIFKELAGRKLVEVQVDKASKIGMNDSCRLHNAVREFCISKGLGEDFFEIVDFEGGKNISTSARRLAIYMNKYKDEKSIPFRSQDTVKKVRSLLIFDAYKSEAQSTWPSNISDLKEFSHLTVLEFNGVDFRVRQVPKGIDKLALLRYLSFRGCWLEVLPSVGKLSYLETLDLRVHDECKMIINDTISGMKRMRHLYFPKLYKSDGKSKLPLQGLESLEILVNFDTEAFRVEDLLNLKNLQILTTISGHHEDLEAIKRYLQDPKTKPQHSSLDIRNFDCYTKERVNVLKELLKCDSLNSIHIQGQIGKLPEDVILSKEFTEIFLNGSELEHDPMSKLGEIRELRSLVLSNDAFIGEEMSIPAAHKFPNLRSLKLLNLKYLKKLTFEEEALPELSTLVIDKCDCLKELKIPKTLQDRLQEAEQENEGILSQFRHCLPKSDI